MSAQSQPIGEQDRWGWLPRRLRPGVDPPEGPRRGDRRLVESFIVGAVGALLIAATIGDLARQVRLDRRFYHDQRTFLAYTHYKPYGYGIKPGIGTSTDIICAPTKHTAVVNLCLVVDGRAHHAIRHIAGGFSLPLRRHDIAKYRYDCFGAAAAQRLCKAS
ncbi:MAG TPA: hypothetical protein VHX88_07710, partial [Solirubrobacteraceae bacterium]|nr:hypothetical protein [Solirubrobacteraceae bacterium]